jgi:hypothetical protein
MLASRLLAVSAVLAAFFGGQSTRPRPIAVLETATPLTFQAATDSNSPAFWRMRRGVATLSILNSTGSPTLTSGGDLDGIEVVGPASIDGDVVGGWWMESVVPDYRGVLYGYYHNEQPSPCGGNRAVPRIGAARSFDGGRTWTHLGFVLEAPTGTINCQSANRYFVGGVGDFSAILDQSRNYLYIYFSSYVSQASGQGVAVARLRWSDRDDPVGRVAAWDDGVWRYPDEDADGVLSYQAAKPFLTAGGSWHGRTGVDAFWGPSLHWNTFLNRYVMLLNRARDGSFAQEGIYITHATTLDTPSAWAAPLRLLAGGRWYPQVVGVEPGSGTDKLAGERARLFVSGTSDYTILFQLPDTVANPR